MTPPAQSIKKNDKLGFIKFRNFYSVKNTVQRMERQITNRENYLKSTHLVRGLYWSYPLLILYKKTLKNQLKKHLKINKKYRSTHLQKKKRNEGLEHISKEDTQMANMHTKRCSKWLVIRKLHIEILRYYCILNRMAKSKNKN